ncbi:MAG: IS110 family transposase [Planctomycetaceae bacterium]|nr:MAG: IS110 family transposase [Planctomycetaceae bacterium]
MLYVGIDQHRKQLTVNVRDEAGQIVLRRQVSTAWDRVTAFLDDLEQRSRDCDGYVAVVEICGFNAWLLKLLNTRAPACRQTIVVQPEFQSSHKTDRRDASGLSELLWVNRERLLAGRKVNGLRCVRTPSADDQADRQLTALRVTSGRELTRTVNRVKAILRRHNLEQECPTKGLGTRRARAWLMTLPLSAVERLELNQLLLRWDQFAAQRQQLEALIGERQKQNRAAIILASIPGAAAYSSLALACRVGDVSRFPHPRSLANYWGLTPRSRNSGEATQRLGSITKEGSRIARFLLGQLVMHVLRRDGVMRGWYKRLKRRRGSKIARVAVMRRLATIIWHMLTKQERYRCGGPPRERLVSTTAAPVTTSPPRRREPNKRSDHKPAQQRDESNETKNDQQSRTPVRGFAPEPPGFSEA